jgi:hypothetical protein
MHDTSFRNVEQRGDRRAASATRRRAQRARDAPLLFDVGEDGELGAEPADL